MKFYDTTLKQLYDMTAEKKRLDAKYADLKAQAAAYEEQLISLRAVCVFPLECSGAGSDIGQGKGDQYS